MEEEVVVWYRKVLKFYFIPSTLQQRKPNAVEQVERKLNVYTDGADHVDGAKPIHCEYCAVIELRRSTHPNANDAGIPSTERLTKDRSA